MFLLDSNPRLEMDQFCPCCGAAIQKTAYMGGSVYMRQTCQPLP
jgi:hypothetical protein